MGRKKEAREARGKDVTKEVQGGAREVQGGAKEVQGGAREVQGGAREVQGGAREVRGDGPCEVGAKEKQRLQMVTRLAKL